MIYGTILCTFGITALYNFSLANVRSEKHSQLRAITHTIGNQISHEIDDASDAIDTLSRDDAIVSCLTEMQSTPQTCTKDQLSTLLFRRILPGSNHFFELYVIDNTGVIVASSSQDRKIPEDVSASSEYLEGKVGVYISQIYQDAPSNSRLMNFAHPINDQNARRGILVIRQQTDDIELPLQGITGMGASFDGYIVNRESIRLTPVLRTQEGAMERVSDANTQKCLADYDEYGLEVDEKGHFEEVVTFEKSDGQKVYATHDYVPEMRWCVMTEVKESESLEAITGARPFYILIGFMLIIIVYFISLWVGSYISKPIEELGRNVEIMLEGDFDHTVSMEGKDDVSKLSHIIESIRLTLRKFRDEAAKKKDGE